MKDLINEVEKLRRTDIRSVIDGRMEEFRALGKKGAGELFNELCFCILTANFTAERGIRIQKEIGNGFHKLTEKELAARLKELGHRFPNMRAKFIAGARGLKDELSKLLKTNNNDSELRQWLAENVKGLGYKESSHFLRNIGRENCAIIDFHIVDLMAEHGLIKHCDSLTKKKYLEIEQVLAVLAQRLGITLGELDLYLWYLETGKILK